MNCPQIGESGGDPLVLFVVDFRFRGRQRFGRRDHQHGQSMECRFRKARGAKSSDHAAESPLEKRRARRIRCTPNATVAMTCC